MAFLLLCSLLAAVQAAVLLPSADPFYQPPAGFGATAPGTVLRYRPISANNLGSIPITAYQLLYRSRAINGAAIATVSTVLVPQNATFDKFVSFQVAEDSSDVDCAPSYNLQDGASANNQPANLENPRIETYLSTGLIVAIPDHEGPDGAFAAGRLEGYLVLDGMRAVSSYLGTSPAIVGVGYSGGAIATGWAASLQPGYAPELAIKAWTIGGVPANLSSVVRYVDRGAFAGFQPDGLAGLSKPSAYQSTLQPMFDTYLTPYGKAQVASAASNCVGTDIFAFGGQSIFAYTFSFLGPNILHQTPLAAVLAQCTMGVNKNETPSVPVLLYQAELDEIVPYADVSTLYNNWCADGASVHLISYTTGGHLAAESAGLVPAIKYAQAAFAGSLSSGCSSESVSTVAVDPNSLGPQSEDALLSVINIGLRAGEPNYDR